MLVFLDLLVIRSGWHVMYQSLVFPCLPMTRGHGSSATLTNEVMQGDFVWSIDQTVVLCVEKVVVHDCEKDKVEKECAEEVEKVEDQTTTNASVRLGARE